jgi:putative endonuclease
MKYGGYVYILTNNNNTVLYTGVTSNLPRRLEEHRTGKHINAFTKKYNCTKIVYFEGFNRIEDAIGREKQLKGGSRAKKTALIDNYNPEWKDLSNYLDEWD